MLSFSCPSKPSLPLPPPPTVGGRSVAEISMETELGKEEGKEEKDKLPSWCRLLVWMRDPVILYLRPSRLEQQEVCRVGWF